MSHSPCPISAEVCVARERYGACFSDVHHRYYPRGLFRTAVEKAFRELPENKEQLCRAEHDDIHANEQPPIKPSRDEMLLAIARSAMTDPLEGAA